MSLKIILGVYNMFKLKNFYCISLLISFFIILNTPCIADSLINDAYANPGGQGHGNGKGHNQGNGKGHSKANNANHKHKNAAADVSHSAKSNKIRFSDKDGVTITKYYSANPFPVSTLPPGIAKNLLRGKPLPPGIAKEFLPSDLVSQLPAYPGYEYLVAGKDVVLVNSTSQIVADVLSNVLR